MVEATCSAMETSEPWLTPLATWMKRCFVRKTPRFSTMPMSAPMIALSLVRVIWISRVNCWASRLTSRIRMNRKLFRGWIPA